MKMKLHCFTVMAVFKWLQEAQLSQRDRPTAARSILAKYNIKQYSSLRTLLVYLQPL